MTTTPEISVLMPCLNSRPHIAAAVESILLQSMRRFELVLIDNGSTDGNLRVHPKPDRPQNPDIRLS